jgi:ABC-type polysaccharide/polyol phosphate transport system ATPase subunit
MVAIEVAGVTKVYRRFRERRQFATLKSALLGGTVFRDLRPDKKFAAVRNVSFKVPQGATFGLIGPNGSGKSTMLKLVAGITKPTEGRVSVAGRVSALIELGAGFHPEISGRENVFINGIMLGLSKREITRRFDEIVEFAELQDFIDAPVKTYSSGMYVRLGFAVAINVDPDVLLIDEVLAVGDEAFAHKCLDKFADFKRRGKTILLVTHQLNLVEQFCDDVLWLESGKIRGEGDPKTVVSAYMRAVAKSEEESLAASHPKTDERAGQAGPEAAPRRAAVDAPGAAGERLRRLLGASEGRRGSREVEIETVRLLGADGAPRQVYESGDAATIEMIVRAHETVGDVVFSVGVFNGDGICCYGTNTDIDALDVSPFSGAQRLSFHIKSLDLVPGMYALDLIAHRRDGYVYDGHCRLHTFHVKSRTGDVGIYRPSHTWEFTAGLGAKDAPGLK